MLREITYGQAISEALVQGMRQNPGVFILGIGVDDCRGIFNTTRDAFGRFGSSRVLDAPASEGALTGIAIGAALNGKHPVLVHARQDFMFLALDQMINNAAKWKYTYNGQSSLPILVRTIVGKGWGQGPTHSQNLQAVLAHFPGLTVAVPSNAYDMKGIILESLQISKPVVIVEHRSLYDLSAHVPKEAYRLPLGRARVVREGADLTIVATSFMVVQALKAAEALQKAGISVEVIDPVTIQPLDESCILASVEKTGRLIVADCDWVFCGFASEVAAIAAEKAFDSLKAPVKRIGWPHCPCPVSKTLEDAFYPTHDQIIAAAYALMERKEKPVFLEKVTDTFIGPY